jgi:hypothetical protein
MTMLKLVFMAAAAAAAAAPLRDERWALRRRRHGRCLAMAPSPRRAACLVRSDPRVLDWPPSLEVEWRLPIGCDFSGFFVEVALGYVPDLLDAGVPIRLLQGRCPDAFLDGMLTAREAAAYRIAQREDRDRTPAQSANSIVIEHAEPCKMRTFERAPRRLVSRAMSEGLLAGNQVACLNRAAHEVWLPTWRHATLFRRSGMSPDVRAVVIPESADVTFFERSTELLLACGGGGGAACRWALRNTTKQPFPFSRPLTDRRVVFFSVFKWEWRKGYDVLLGGYWDEFAGDFDRDFEGGGGNGTEGGGTEDSGAVGDAERGGVVLVLKTYKPNWEPGPADVDAWISDLALKRGKTRAELPRVVVIQRDASRHEMRRLYAAADCFVLPTRGEGWGLPAFEAMTMALPTIVTNCAGPSAFASGRSAYPLKVEGAHPDAKVRCAPPPLPPLPLSLPPTCPRCAPSRRALRAHALSASPPSPRARAHARAPRLSISLARSSSSSAGGAIAQPLARAHAARLRVRCEPPRRDAAAACDRGGRRCERDGQQSVRRDGHQSRACALAHPNALPPARDREHDCCPPPRPRSAQRGGGGSKYGEGKEYE